MSANRIPKVYHFVFGLKPQRWPFHLAHYLCLSSCLEVNQPERVLFHYHHEPYGRLWDLIKEQLTLVKVEPNDFVAGYEYQDAFIGQFRYAHHADFIRLEALRAHGGVYADMDTLFVNPLPAHLWEQPCVMGFEDDVYCKESDTFRKSLCNAVIMSEPNGHFVNTWLSRTRAAFNGTWSNHSTLLPYELSVRHPHWLHVEPIRSFFYHGPSQEGIDTLFHRRDDDFEGIYSMHLWSHLWWSWRRRDFSHFSALKLTEHYVRKADTTFAMAARPFLPPKKPFLFGLR